MKLLIKDLLLLRSSSSSHKQLWSYCIMASIYSHSQNTIEEWDYTQQSFVSEAKASPLHHRHCLEYWIKFEIKIHELIREKRTLLAISQEKKRLEVLCCRDNSYPYSQFGS